MATQAPVPYGDDVETELVDEAAVVDETIATMKHTTAQGFELTRHATSGTHAKSHGIVTGTLTVLADLSDEPAQGLCSTPGEYGVVIRYASEPGLIDPDTTPRARGLALTSLSTFGPSPGAQGDDL